MGHCKLSRRNSPKKTSSYGVSDSRNDLIWDMSLGICRPFCRLESVLGSKECRRNAWDVPLFISMEMHWASRWVVFLSVVFFYGLAYSFFVAGDIGAYYRARKSPKLIAATSSISTKIKLVDPKTGSCVDYEALDLCRYAWKISPMPAQAHDSVREWFMPDKHHSSSSW